MIKYVGLQRALQLAAVELISNSIGAWIIDFRTSSQWQDGCHVQEWKLDHQNQKQNETN